MVKKFLEIKATSKLVATYLFIFIKVDIGYILMRQQLSKTKYILQYSIDVFKMEVSDLMASLE